MIPNWQGWRVQWQKWVVTTDCSQSFIVKKIHWAVVWKMDEDDTNMVCDDQGAGDHNSPKER